jgi:hypothetical protein
MLSRPLFKLSPSKQPFFTQRRIAQLGVTAASLCLVLCMTVLIAGARDGSTATHPVASPVLSETHMPAVSPVIAPEHVSLQGDSSTTVATNKQ